MSYSFRIFWLEFDETQASVLIWIYTSYFYNEKCREFRMSGGSEAAIIDFVTDGLVVVLCLGLRSTRTLVRSPLVSSHLFSGQHDPWSFLTSIEPSQLDSRYFSHQFSCKTLK